MCIHLTAPGSKAENNIANDPDLEGTSAIDFILPPERRVCRLVSIVLQLYPILSMPM